ncbi:MAG: discoidin domain-containing protein [Elusimicrobia bacterium]|nr:discoidin domain-containing protein [Elusimicrobiota bacterium]
MIKLITLLSFLLYPCTAFAAYVELDYMEYAPVPGGAYAMDKIPDMTSNIAPSGVASASAEYFPAWYALNDSNVGSDDWWMSLVALPQWLKYQFTSGKTIQGYAIAARDYPTIYYPSGWTLQGSNNDADWTSLDTQTGQTFTQAERKIYGFTNSTSYIYYRLYITAGEQALYVGMGEFELMEWEAIDDDTAHTVYISNGDYSLDRIPDMTSNIAPSGVASASLAYFPAWYALNDSNVGSDDWWIATGGMTPQWLQYQFTSGKTIQRYTIAARDYPTVYYPSEWTLYGSNNNADWTSLDTQTGQTFTQAQKKTYDFFNLAPYVYYRIYITAREQALYVGMGEFELMERALQCGSESTIKTQGSYALKGIATTDSLNDTLTRTVSPTIDLTGQTRIKFSIRASRTGSNIKIGVHDSGGTTTEITPNILAADTFQTIWWDISAVANADKDAIDQIIITIVNAVAANTFYIDDMYALHGQVIMLLGN